LFKIILSIEAGHVWSLHQLFVMLDKTKKKILIPQIKQKRAISSA